MMFFAIRTFIRKKVKLIGIENVGKNYLVGIKQSSLLLNMVIFFSKA